MPELLPFLLRHYARDPVNSVRVSILRRLPYLTFKRPDLGWQLFNDVFQEPQTHLWSHAEAFFYSQYWDHFDEMAPYLERLRREALEEAGDTWGRIATLSNLAGHIEHDELFAILATANDRAWMGATQVFTANLDRHEHTASCHAGLLAILKQGNLSDDVIQTIERGFEEESKKGLIDQELALTFLAALPTVRGNPNVHYFLEWLGYEARRDPLSALSVTEVLFETLKRREGPIQIWGTEPLIAALVEILREADETEDLALIQRAINLQDGLLQLNIHGMQDLLERAGKS